MSDLTELFTWTCSRCDDMTEVLIDTNLLCSANYKINLSG